MQKRHTFRRAAGLCTALILLFSGEKSQAQSTTLNQNIATELQTLSAGAGTIFVGQITSILREKGAVEVTFRVEQPVAGAQGARFVLREWAGLWPPGHLRYTPGQRVLAFLHTPSAAGFSTPVHGAEGLIPVVVQGLGAPRLLDVRRVAASVVRSPNTPLPTDAEAAMLLTDALDLVVPRASPAAKAPARLPLPQHGKQPLDLPESGSPHRIVLPGRGNEIQ